MIQEQISTSSPKCLDGNSGFGIVAQTSGMAPNVAQEVSMLSGYTHQFAAGDDRNPVAFLHVVRRTGGTNRHIVSRVADCGNDYSGRTNRIAHHWIIEESDLSGLPCGPAAILSLSENFPLKPMFLGASGTVQHPESIHPKFADLWVLKDKFSLRYISYIPNSVFSDKNISPHEIVISCQNEDVFRFFLDEKGLHGQWLESSSITPESLRKLNGIAIGELEIVQISNENLIKELPLFSPIEYATFRPSQRQITLSGFDYDFNALGFSSSQLLITDTKGYRTRYMWETLAPDTLKFQVDDNDTIHIKLIPQTPVAKNSGEWNIPIEVDEIKRDSALLKRYIYNTKISPEMVDAKVKEGTEAVNRARSNMLEVRRQFNRNNSNANKASRAIGVLNRQLSMANSAAAASISSRISHQESIISNCRSANSRLEPQLNNLEKVYDNYYGKLKVLKEYKALLDKVKIIYQGEPMTFAIMITHPTDSKRKLKLLSIKEPDMANEKDAVIPEPTDNDTKIDKDEDVEDEEEDDDKDDENKSENSKTRSFLGTNKK